MEFTFFKYLNISLWHVFMKLFQLVIIVYLTSCMYTCCISTVFMLLYLSRDLLVRGDQPVPLDLLDLLADQALRGLQDPLERKEFLWVSVDVCPMYSRAPDSTFKIRCCTSNQSLNVKYSYCYSCLFSSLRVRKDLLALQVVMVSRVPWVFLDLPDHQEYPERMETRPVTLSNNLNNPKLCWRNVESPNVMHY